MIELHNIYKTYKMGLVEVNALQGIDIHISRSEYVAIMGPSGSGKSTIMNIIGCLDTPTSGRYELDGERVDSLDDKALANLRNRKIGFVFQTFNLLSNYTAQSNVELPLIYANIERKKRKELALNVLKEVNLLDRAMHKPNELSGGERQRVAIARALINNPSILLADEPTGNLDRKVGWEIIDLFQKLNKENQVTLIIVTHDREIAHTAPRIIHIIDGKTV